MMRRTTYRIIVFVVFAATLLHQSTAIDVANSAHEYVMYAPDMMGLSPALPGNGSTYSTGISIANVSTRPTIGTVRLAIILAQFSDIPAKRTPEEIRQDYFGTNHSVAAYYQQVSYGKLTLTGDVFGWYTLPYPESHYGRDCLAVDDADCSGSDQSWQIAQDAATLARNDLTFAKYDYYVFVHSGDGEESSHVGDDVWSVTYLGGVYVNPCLDVQEDCNQKTLTKFNITPELEAGTAVPLGVYCHEFGHQLGLPDMYDTHTGKSMIGDWELMDKGLWNGSPKGSEPAELSSWSRERLGWLSPDHFSTVQMSSDDLTDVEPLELAPLNGSISAVVVPISGENYYLFENRQALGNDVYLPDHGIVGYHIDETDNVFSTIESPAAIAAFHPGDLVSTSQLRAKVMAASSNSSLLLAFGSASNETAQQYSSLTLSIVPNVSIPVTINNQTYITNSTTGKVSVIEQYSNETFAVNVPQTVETRPGVRIVFTGWENGDPNNSQSVLLTSNVTLTATYQRQYYVSVSSQHGTPTGSGWFNENAQDNVSVDSVINDGTGTRYVFAGWSGTINGTSNPTNFLVTDPMNLTATWTTFNSMQFVFYDANSSEISPTLLDSLTLKAPNGTLLELSNLQPNSSYWFEKGDYDIVTAYVYGVDTVAGPLHFDTAPNAIESVPLELYTITFKVNDFIFGSPLDGGTVNIALPNGQAESATINNGQALFEHLPPALYSFNVTRDWSIGMTGETSLPNQPIATVQLIVIPSVLLVVFSFGSILAVTIILLRRSGSTPKYTQSRPRRDRTYSHA